MNGIKPYFLRLTIVFGIILSAASSCSDEYYSSIPDVAVRLNLNLSIHNELKTAGTPYLYPGGYGGIIVLYNGLEYYAFDAACPYEANRNIAVVLDGIYGTCPECGSKYNLWFGGTLESGPSTESLKIYTTSVTSEYLYVRN